MERIYSEVHDIKQSQVEISREMSLLRESLGVEEERPHNFPAASEEEFLRLVNEIDRNLLVSIIQNSELFNNQKNSKIILSVFEPDTSLFLADFCAICN